MSARILIIDAETEFTSELVEVLGARGVDVTIAADGKAGLDLAKTTSFDAMVVCVELPRMSGYSVCTKMRKDEALKSIPVIITSSGATPETFESHSRLSTRANEYLKKPFPPALLVDTLKRYVPGITDSAPVAGEDIDIADDGSLRPDLLDDAEVFTGDEARSMDEADGVVADAHAPSATRSAAIDSAAASSEGTSSGVLSSRARMPTNRGDDAEVPTNVGRLEDSAYARAPASIRVPPRRSIPRMGRLDVPEPVVDSGTPAQSTAEPLKSVRQGAGSTLSVVSSSTPQNASSRELLDLKRERNQKDKEIHALKTQLHEKEAELLAWSDKETDFEGEIVRLQETLQQADESLQALEAKSSEQIRALNLSAADLRRRLGDSTARASELEAKANGLQEELNAARARIAEQERDAQTLDEDLSRTRGELEAERQRHAATTDANKSLGAELEDASRELEEARRELEQTTEAYEATGRELEESGRMVERLTLEIAQAHETINERNNRIEQLEIELESALGENERISGELSERTTERDRTQSALTKSLGEQARLKNELEAANAEAEGLRDKLRAREEEVERQMNELAALQDTLEAERQERNGLRGLIEEISAERDRVEQHLGSAYQRLRDEESVRQKTLQALDIAAGLLRDAGFQTTSVPPAEGDEARS